MHCELKFYEMPPTCSNDVFAVIVLTHFALTSTNVQICRIVKLYFQDFVILIKITHKKAWYIKNIMFLSRKYKIQVKYVYIQMYDL